MLNLLKKLAPKSAAPAPDKQATEGSCGTKEGAEMKKEDKGGCCGGHCH